MRTNLEERLNSFISCFAKISLLCSFNASNCVFRFYHIQDQSLGLFHCWLEYGKSLLKILADQRNYVWQLVEILSTSFWHFFDMLVTWVLIERFFKMWWHVSKTPWSDFDYSLFSSVDWAKALNNRVGWAVGNITFSSNIGNLNGLHITVLTTPKRCFLAK